MNHRKMMANEMKRINKAVVEADTPEGEAVSFLKQALVGPAIYDLNCIALEEED